MNDTIGQNGVSSSHLSGHRHHGSIPHTPARQDEPHHSSSSGSSNQPSAPYQPVSDHEGKENERLQNREILLKLLQPPGATVTRHAQCGSCTLPHQESEKTSFKPDLCGSHCLRCTSFQQAPRNLVDIGREANEEWNQKTWHSNCINSEIKGQKQNYFTNRNKTESNFRDRETVVNPGKNLLRPDAERTNVFPTMVRCQSCDVTSRARPFRSEELQLHPDGSQHFPAERQQHSNPCFRKDTATHDPMSATLHQRTRQIERNIPIKINGELPRKDQGNLKRMCPSTWGYQNCDSWKCQHPPSTQILVQDHPQMGITSADKRTDIVLNTDRHPDHFRPVEGGKDVVRHVEKITHQGRSPTTQDKLEEHKLNSSSSYSMCSSGSYRREMFRPSGQWNSPVARIDNGQEHCREERNIRFEKPSESDNQALPDSPNESSHMIETQSDECTPVIVQCYSLSTVSPTLEPTSMRDSHFTITQKTDGSVNIGNGDPTVPVSHSRCLYQQHSPKSHKPAGLLQGNENVMYNCPTPGPRSSANPHNHKFITQQRHAMDELSTPELGVDDEQNQSHSTTLPGQFHKRCTIPASFPCLNCQPGQHTFKNGYDGNCTQTPRRDHHPYNNQWSEPHRNASQNVSQQGGIHAANDYQRTRSAVDVCDRHADAHTPGETFRNWHTRQVPRESRPALKIHDYYEERRILVGKVYQDIPGSVESAESNQNSAIQYARPRQEYQEDHHQHGAASAEVFQAPPASEEGALQICVHQSKIAVGSKKRKSRQPRPQRVKTNDPALETDRCQHQIQYAENRQEESSHNSYHHQGSSSFLHNALVSKEACRNRTEDVGVRVNESEIYSYEPVHEPTDPVQPESGRRRDDHVFENSSSRPEFCRNEIPAETHQPWRTPFHDKRTSKVPAERCDPFLEYSRGPSYGPIGRHHRISHEYQTNSYCQSKTPQRFLAYSNGTVTKRPLNSSPEGNTTHQHWHGPTWTRGPEKHFETLDKTRTGYDSTHASCSSRMLVSYSGQSQRNVPTDNSVTSQFERDCESSWNVPASSVHGEHQDNSFVHHAVSANGKSPHNNSEMHSSLPNDNGSVSSTTVDDMVEPQEKHGSDRPFQSIEASAIIDRESGPMKEQNTAFSENRGFFLHTREVLANYMAPALKEKRFLCRYCSKKFAHFSTLQNHLRTHTGDKPFQCKFCSRRFAQSGVLKAHLRTHTGDKPFACMYCGKDFAQSTTLTNHLRTHTGQKPYICQYCNKSFSQPSTLRKHELSHTKERPYPCKFCGKAFAQQSTLTNHMRSHTGQRPYKCHFCDKSFAQLSTLDRHLRLHSSVSLKPHQCQYCSKSFSYFSNLASHMQIHEQEQA